MSEQTWEAGRELDALIAERVMGFQRVPFQSRDVDGVMHEGEVLLPPGTQWREIQDYFPKRGPIAFAFWVVSKFSTDIAAAWLVVEAMAQRGFSVSIEWKGKGRDFENTAEVYFRHGLEGGHGFGDSAPLAICRAALQASELAAALAAIAAATGAGGV